MLDDELIFVIMIFITVFLLIFGLTVPSFGTGAQMGRRLKGRIQPAKTSEDTAVTALLREKYLQDLSPLQRWFETLPGMEKLSTLIEQSGSSIKAHRLVFLALALAFGAALVSALLLVHPLIVILVATSVFFIPLLKLQYDRNKRIEQFEEQLPDVLEMISRGLRAGLPFTECLGLVGEEMAEPSGLEFRKVFYDINYGMTVKVALSGLMQRVPSISFLAMMTAVVVQRETGGNLAEILSKVAVVLRGRFRFQRKVKTLSAEGRLSGWILVLIPFVLSALLSITTPEYLPLLLKDPLGRQLIMTSFGFIIVGIFWIRYILKIDI